MSHSVPVEAHAECRRPRSRAARLLALATVTASLAFGTAAAAPGTGAPGTATPPENRGDLQAWMEYQRASGSPSMPAVAQIFHRRGLETLRSGAREDGVRLLRGASELDPTFLAPRLALLRHFAFQDPSQALRELAKILELARSHFPLQHHFAMWVAFYLLLAAFLGSLFSSVYVIWKRREGLRHGYQEFLRRRVSARMAQAGSWSLLAVPFVVGAGLALPAVFTLGALWSWLKKSERMLFLFLVLLLASGPWTLGFLASVAVPDHRDEGPFYGTVTLEHAPFDERRLESLLRLAEAHPENPYLHFSAAWMAQRGGRFELAREKFLAAGELWPEEPRIPNNLGNLAVLRGDDEQAEHYYREAAAQDPSWAMPHFNLGQLYTRQFRYAEASEELARATSFDFELVRSLQAQAQSGDPLPLAWGWPAPETFWNALFRDTAPHAAPVLPEAWMGWLELRTPALSWLALVLAGAGLLLGWTMRRRLPVRWCTNCRASVCRRCATPRRDQLFCNECNRVMLESSAAEFARLLLLRRRRTANQLQQRTHTALAALLPGFGPAAMDRLGTAVFLTAVAAVGIAALAGVQPPYSYDPRIGPLAPRGFDAGTFLLLIAAHGLSVLVYLGLRANATEQETEATTLRKPSTRLPRAA